MNEEKNKCTQYEGLFVFQDEEKLKKHLEICPDCAEEYRKQMKVSSLVKEAAPYYLEQEKRKNFKRTAQKIACCLLVFIGLSAFTGIKIYDNYVYQAGLEQESAVSEMGLPVDEYGFLYI